jgi:hypothetical protein
MRFHMTTTLSRAPSRACIAVVSAAAMALALAACSLGGLGGPYPGVPELQSTPHYDIRGRPEWIPPSSGGVKKAVAPPQVTYRIDEKQVL